MSRPGVLERGKQTNPDIAAISEANLQYETELHERHIPGYRLVTTRDYELGGISRLVALVKDGMNIKILEDKKVAGISSIWIKVPRRGQRPVTIGMVYREHHLLGIPAPNNSDDPRQQRTRWRKTLDQWTAIPNGR